MDEAAGTADSTIFALSSGKPPCAIAVVRISGPLAFDVVERLTGRAVPSAHKAALRHLHDPGTGAPIDEGLVLRFDARASVTGEPLVELQVHGSRAVVRDLETVLARFDGVRAAEPGEFTRRAFQNGRLDLDAVEGLGDLLTAETTLQRQAALAMMGGRLGQDIARWSHALTRLAAQVEARLDFSDEGDVASDAGPGFDLACAGIADEMGAALARPPAHRLRDGVRVAIGGPPNAGKSTLFNAILGREAAIVSPHAGTTRDVIEASIAIDGMPFLFSDSAGLRDATDEIERIGIDRATKLVEEADILLWLSENEAPARDHGHVIRLRAKADLRAGEGGSEGLAVSAVTGQGMDVLFTTLTGLAADLLPGPGDYALSARQRAALARAESAVREAGQHRDEILIGECLRQALVALDELTGRTTTEAVLDEIFSAFCIGK